MPTIRVLCDPRTSFADRRSCKHCLHVPGQNCVGHDAFPRRQLSRTFSCMQMPTIFASFPMMTLSPMTATPTRFRHWLAYATMPRWSPIVAGPSRTLEVLDWQF